MTGTRLGVLGGTFDPVHRGHLDVAEAAGRALALDPVLLVPARTPPHRPSSPGASPYHRFAMVALAIRDRPGVRASDLELRAPGPSYTSTTLARLHGSGYLPSQLFFITGADAFAEIATWRDYPALLEAAHYVVVGRPGYPVRALRTDLPELADRMIDVPRAAAGAPPQPVAPAIFLVDAVTADVSSTRVRERLRAGGAPGGAVPPDVAAHIERHGLYSAATSAAGGWHEQS